MSVAEQLLRYNADPAQYCEYVPQTLPQIVAALRQPGVQPITAGDGLVVLHQYASGSQWIAEIWGPFMPVPTEAGITHVLSQALPQIAKRPASLHFFIGGQNLLLQSWLTTAGANFSGQTVWQMKPVAARPEASVKSATVPLGWPEGPAVMQLHQALFGDAPLPQVSAQQPLWRTMIDGTIGGYALATQATHHHAEVKFLGVDQSVRRRGLATDLLGAVWSDLSREGFEDVTLMQSTQAIGANALFSKLGFRRVRALLSATVQLD